MVDDLDAARRAGISEEVLAGLRAGFLTLLNQLMDVHDRAIQAGRADSGGRDAALKALAATTIFLFGFPSLRPYLNPLANVCTALDELDSRGTVAPMFEPPPSKAYNALPYQRVRLHSFAAAWAEALTLAGTPAGEAHKIVARGLHGYSLRVRDGGEKAPTAGTVKEWRKQAKRDLPVGVDAATYTAALASLSRMSAGEINAAVPLLLRIEVPHLFARREG